MHSHTHTHNARVHVGNMLRDTPGSSVDVLQPAWGRHVTSGPRSGEEQTTEPGVGDKLIDISGYCTILVAAAMFDNGYNATHHNERRRCSAYSN